LRATPTTLVTLRKLLFIVAVAAALGLLVDVRGVPSTSTVQAQVPWPTPPPGPSTRPLTVIPADQVVPVAAAQKPGSIAATINPVWPGPLPRIPPLPSIPLITSEPDPQERVQIVIEAGTFLETFQMTYEPIAASDAPRPLRGQHLRRAFRIRTFDHRGQETPLEFSRPVKVMVRYQHQDLEAAGGDPGALFMARWDASSDTWVPLVTAVMPQEQAIAIRILSPGLLALIAEPDPVPPPGA